MLVDIYQIVATSNTGLKIKIVGIGLADFKQIKFEYCEIIANKFCDYKFPITEAIDFLNMNCRTKKIINCNCFTI